MTIHWVGNVVLMGAWLLACLQSLLPSVGYVYGNKYLTSFAHPLALAQFALVAIAYLLLIFAFVDNDFTLSYVLLNSHPALPLIYKITATWGAHEGSILLWILILNIWSLLFTFTALSSQTNPSYPPTKTDGKLTLTAPPISCPSQLASSRVLTLALLGLMSFCFLSFLIFTSNPFALATIASAPQDLNPLLQDPGLVSHPPMLYMGYVGFSVAFAMTLAALINNQLPQAWLRLTRYFVILAWGFLTLGILLGSLWAYRVLGWGGFWFWDPVENASLLPWLAGTALIHSLIVVEKSHTGYRIAIILSLICFCLSLLGTFLVRSGILISAHTFASDPKRGVLLLLFFVIFASVSFTLYYLRLAKFHQEQQVGKHNKIERSLFSRETLLLFNSGIFIVAMLTVLLGTLYPLILDALHLGAVSVGAPYFNQVMLPMNMVMMLIMGIAPFCQWQQQPVGRLLSNLVMPFILSLCISLSLMWSFNITFHAMTLLNLFLCFWILIGVLGKFKFRPSMAFAHIGFALLILGIVLSNSLSEEREVRLQIGQAVTIGPYQFFFLKSEEKDGENYRGIQAIFDVVKKKQHITYLYPEKRIYPVRDMVMTKVDIHPSIFRDLYIALGEPLSEIEWTLRIYYKPFIRFIWFGGFLMLIGTLFACLRVRSIKGYS